MTLIAELEQSEEWNGTIAAVMASEAGQRMLSMLCAVVHPLGCPFDNPQPERMAGRQEVVAALWRGQERIVSPPRTTPIKPKS